MGLSRQRLQLTIAVQLSQFTKDLRERGNPSRHSGSVFCHPERSRGISRHFCAPMNTNNGSEEPKAAETSLPNSTKVYVAGTQHKDIRVPFREISLAPTKTMSGEVELNEPVRVYDTSGPWGDPTVALSVEEGLPLLRAPWIAARADTEEYE